jgi:hypothetical protein
MAKTAAAKATSSNQEPSKQQLQRQMARTRESLAETVGEIKETVAQEAIAVKKTVSDVLDYRNEFQKDPIVWSLGALSAGFALGYTVGYAHKNTKRGKQNQITAFADTMIDQLSTMGHGLVLPAIDAKISELFGFNFSEMLNEAGREKKSSGKKKGGRRSTKKVSGKARASAKKSSSAKSRSSRKKAAA